jgi:hypothetical protein
MTIVVVVLFQLACVFYQSSIHPRFFIPSRFLPKRHNYFQELDKDVEAQEECAVCILPLAQDTNIQLS